MDTEFGTIFGNVWQKIREARIVRGRAHQQNSPNAGAI